MNRQYCFIFNPELPTIDSYKSKNFPDYISKDTFFADIKKREQDKQTSYSGYLYFKGPYENFHNGTVKIYNNPKWWESGAKSCVNGCCKIPLEKDYIVGTIRPPNQRNYFPRQWLEFKNIDHLAEIFAKITDMDGILQIRFTNYGYFTVKEYFATMN